MCVCIRVCVFVFIAVHLCLFVYLYVHVFVFVFVCVFVFLLVWMCVVSVWSGQWWLCWDWGWGDVKMGLLLVFRKQ